MAAPRFQNAAALESYQQTASGFVVASAQSIGFQELDCFVAVAPREDEAVSTKHRIA
jgi:hypothetical protein